MQINVKKLHPDATLPTYGTGGAACFDIYTTSEGFIPGDESRVFNTGLAFEIPVGFVMLVYSRSGHAFKDDVRLANCVGVIDSDYRGELKIKLTADNICNGFHVDKGVRIAQGMVIPVTQNTFNVVEHLSDTSRGTGGFGSTGN